MSGSAEAREVLTKYLKVLTSNYSKLLNILDLEHVDIGKSDEKALTEHTNLEKQTVSLIQSLTKTVYSYLEKTEPDADAAALLEIISGARKEADLRSRRNIKLLDGELLKLKARLSANKLPKTARRVYYSGETPTMMDIEI